MKIGRRSFLTVLASVPVALAATPRDELTPDEWRERFLVKRQLLREYPTGLPTIDQATGGFQPGELWTHAAPSMGFKTTTALNWIHNLAMRGHNVCYMSWEMSPNMIRQRLRAMRPRVMPSHPVGSVHFDDRSQSVKELSQKAEKIPGRMVFLIDHPLLSREDLWDAKRLALAKDTPVIVMFRTRHHLRTPQESVTTRYSREVEQTSDVISSSQGVGVGVDRLIRYTVWKNRDGHSVPTFEARRLPSGRIKELLPNARRASAKV